MTIINLLKMLLIFAFILSILPIGIFIGNTSTYLAKKTGWDIGNTAIVLSLFFVFLLPIAYKILDSII